MTIHGKVQPGLRTFTARGYFCPSPRFALSSFFVDLFRSFLSRTTFVLERTRFGYLFSEIATFRRAPDIVRREISSTYARQVERSTTFALQFVRLFYIIFYAIFNLTDNLSPVTDGSLYRFCATI